MSSKKVVRRQRALHEKERRDGDRRSVLTVAALALAAALIIGLAAALIIGPGGRDQDNGLVWSAAHGHWH